MGVSGNGARVGIRNLTRCAGQDEGKGRRRTQRVSWKTNDVRWAFRKFKTCNCQKISRSSVIRQRTVFSFSGSLQFCMIGATCTCLYVIPFTTSTATTSVTSRPGNQTSCSHLAFVQCVCDVISTRLVWHHHAMFETKPLLLLDMDILECRYLDVTLQLHMWMA